MAALTCANPTCGTGAHRLVIATVHRGDEPIAIVAAATPLKRNRTDHCWLIQCRTCGKWRSWPWRVARELEAA